ncbi:MAG: ATP-binding protein [Muribaculaceae bacterium]|nr:ATP-binding protein [Muribaculaceae bacterium]
MEKVKIKYPVGQQSFEVLRKNGFLYIDKTRFIEKIVTGSQYYFMGRPRRFGKSLFLSTLKSFFEGKRELFKGLYAETMDWNWETYPVLYLDLNTERYAAPGMLDSVLNTMLCEWEDEYGVTQKADTLSQRFKVIIKAAYKKSGHPVVILVDEYDKPLVNNINNREQFESYRDSLAALYSNFKSSADYIRLVFLTGVSRFGKLSVFSGLNNIRDISFMNDFSSICGITEKELTDNFQQGISELAQEYGRSEEDELAQLKRWYDGYHFAAKCPDLYNPFSLLQIFSSRQYFNYWISSGNSSLLAEQLKKTDTDLTELIRQECALSDLEGLDIDSSSPVALLYQTGYLTIKHYDAEDDIYTLGIPNQEVKQGFFESLLPWYTSIQKDQSRVFIVALRKEMERGEVDKFMMRLTSLFAGFGHDLKFNEERNVQNAMLLIFSLVGLKVNTEVKTSDGRIDILVRTPKYVYIMELKYDGSAEEALRQIKEKEYSLPWSIDSRKVIEIGINYSSKKRRIDEWRVNE